MEPETLRVGGADPVSEWAGSLRGFAAGLMRMPLLVKLGLVLVSLFVTLLGIFASVMAIDWLVDCPWNEYGELHTEWLLAGLPCGLYLLGVSIVALWALGLLAYRVKIGSKPSGAASDSTPLRHSLNRLLVAHLAVASLGLMAHFASYSGQMGGALYSSGGDQHRYIRNDLAAERRGAGRDWIDARDISDRGLAALAAKGESLLQLKVAGAGEITTEGLASFERMPNLLHLEFRAAGSQQEWGDAEARLITSSKSLRRLVLMDFSGITDGLLEELIASRPNLISIEVTGRHSISKSGTYTALRASGPPVSVHVWP